MVTEKFNGWMVVGLSQQINEFYYYKIIYSYIGEFLDDYPNGKGKFVNYLSNSYEGEW